MAEDRPAVATKLSVTTANKELDMGGPPVDAIYVWADEATVSINFDADVDSDSFLLIANTMMEFDLNCNKLNYKASTSTANLYVIAVRRNAN